MHEHDQPEPISRAERLMRIRRIAGIASALRFVGSVEYRHVYSRSGGAQYCIGPSADDDIMVVYAKAFDRDANPEDFRLEALIAHECGHQRLLRDAKLRRALAQLQGDALEEILASLVGAALLGESEAAQTLAWKAAVELTDLRVTAETAEHFVERIRELLRKFL